MKIMPHRVIRQLLFAILLVLPSYQANAMNWRLQKLNQLLRTPGIFSLLHQRSLPPNQVVRNPYLLVTIPEHGNDKNQITHYVETNLAPGAQASIPDALHFDIFNLPGTNTLIPLSSNLLGHLDFPQTTLQVNTQNCQSSLYEVEHDNSSPANPTIHTEQHSFNVAGMPNLILGNYLTPGCMRSSLLADRIPTNTHNTLEIIDGGLLGADQPQVPPFSDRAVPNSAERLFYFGPVSSRDPRARLSGKHDSISFTEHPFLPMAQRRLITDWTPGLQVYRNNISGRGWIVSHHAHLTQRGLIIVNISGFFAVVGSNGRGGIIALVPLPLALLLNWVTDDFSKGINKWRSRRDGDNNGPGGASSSGFASSFSHSTRVH